jgi:NADPH:quinone reductase-like Zn-dependent oxidoreductase
MAIFAALTEPFRRPPRALLKKPAGLSFDEAAASVMTGLSAMRAMRDAGQVRPGTGVLVNGASGPEDCLRACRGWCGARGKVAIVL